MDASLRSNDARVHAALRHAKEYAILVLRANALGVCTGPYYAAMRFWEKETLKVAAPIALEALRP